LVTIVIRESTEADSNSTLDAKKDTNLTAEVTDFPNLSPANLVKLMIGGSALSNPPKVAGKTSGEFKGDGSYTRKDTFTSRITARIIDVKPNGVLVLEASKNIKSDKETLKMTLTGTCRREDVAADNTVLSTQIYDLRLNKEHSGEVNGAIKKGIITQFFDLLFNF
jgi:flagellar L-ring protein FlgH